MGIKAVRIKGKWYVRLTWEGRRAHFRAGESEAEAIQIASDFEVMVRIDGEQEALDKFGRKKKTRETVGSYAQKHKRRLAKMDLKQTTVSRYCQDLDNHVVPKLGGLPIGGAIRPVLKDWYGDLVESGLKRDTIRNINAALSSMLSEAMDDGLIDANPALKMGKFYRKAEKKIRTHSG